MALTVPVTPNTRAPVALAGYQDNPVNLGEGLKNLGGGITDVAQKLQVDQSNREKTELDLAYVKQANDDADHLAAMQTAAPPGAPGFPKAVDAEFTARHDALINGFKAQHYSRDNIDEFTVRLAAHRGGLINAGRNYQAKSYDQLVTHKVGEYGDSTNELLRRDYHSLPQVKVMNHNFAASLVDYSDGDKQAVEDKLNGDAEVAAATTHAHNDPEGFLHDTGGVLPETKLDAKLGAVGTRSLIGVIGALESGNRDHYANGRPVVSPKGAQFRMQVMPGTALAPGFGIKGAADGSPAEYNRVGEELIPKLMEKYGGSVDKVLAAYNWDTSAGVSKVDKVVAKYGDNWRLHLPAETRDYVTKGLKLLGPQQAAPTLATAMTEPNIPATSPYPGLKPEQIYSLQGQAQRQIDREHQVVEAGNVAQHQSFINDTHNKIADGVYGQADLNNDYKSGKITDYNERKSLQDQLDIKDKGNANLDGFNQAIATPGFHWDRYDAQNKAWIEAGVQDQAKQVNAQGQPQGPMMAAFNIWNKTGILADAGAAALRGGLIDTNPTTVQQAINIAGNMLHKDPHAFTGVPGGSEIEQAALDYNHYTYGLDMSPDKAAQRISQENTPEYKSKIKIAKPELDAFTAETAKKGVAQEGAFGGGWFSSAPSFQNTAAKNEADVTFAELATEQLKHGKSAADARSIAAAQMQKFYGVTKGGYITKYPPELSYAPINGSIDYVYKEAVAAVKEKTGVDLTKEAHQGSLPIVSLSGDVVNTGGESTVAYDGTNNIQLVPIPRVTNADFQAGRPARYAVRFVHTVDGQVVVDMLKGMFHADGAAARADPGFAAERQRQVMEQRGVHAGLQEMGRQMGSAF